MCLSSVLILYISNSGDQSHGPPSGTPPSVKRKKTNVHVHITKPSPTNGPESDELHLKRVRTKRAGSMDKHLLRMSSSYSRQNRNAAMSLAIKAIGDSLVTPLDLNISPPLFSDADLECGKSKKNVFRFPSVKKKSKSQGHIAGLSQSFDDTLGMESSAQSLSKCPMNDIRELEKELINLPTYEVDPKRINLSTSPLLSRSNSVPEHLSAVSSPAPQVSTVCPFPGINQLAKHNYMSSPNDSQEQIIKNSERETQYMTSDESLQGGHTNQVCQISVSPYHQSTERNSKHPVLRLPSDYDSLGKILRAHMLAPCNYTEKGLVSVCLSVFVFHAIKKVCVFFFHSMRSWSKLPALGWDYL